MSKPSPAVERVILQLQKPYDGYRNCAERIIRALADVTEAEADLMNNVYCKHEAREDGCKAEILSLLEEPTPVDPAIAVVEEHLGWSGTIVEKLLAAIDKAREVKP